MALCTVIILMYVVVCSTCFAANQSASANAPKVYVHIGPSKTGTTYIQDVFARLKDELPARGVCWPTDSSKGGYFLYLARALDANDEKLVSLFRNNIDDCIEKGLTVIISSEHFHFMKDLSTFYEFFKGYNTYIIAFHREMISWAYSSYTQQNKFEVSPVPFGEHMLEVASTMIMTNSSSSRPNVRKFEKMFGRKNMVFVDFDGAIAAGKDIAFVILCDILGIYCNDLPAVPHSQSNVRPEMLPFNIMSMLIHFIRVLGCTVCGKVMGKNMQEFVKRFDSLPTVKLDYVQLPGLWELSDKEEVNFLREYGDLMLYKNQTATRNVARSFSIMELDQEEFYNNIQNTKWLRNEVNKLYKDGFLCDCPDNMQKLMGLVSS